MEKGDRAAETDQTWTRPKVSRTTRESRRTAGKTGTPDRTEHPVPRDRNDPDEQGGARPTPRDQPDGRRAEPTGTADEPRSDDSSRPQATGNRHLRTVGPFIPHFSGRVVEVFGTAQRSKPSTAPLRLATLLFFIAITLPYAVALLPLLVVLLLGWLWLRRRGWVGGGRRMPRSSKRSTPDAGLLVTSFRVRISRDAEEVENCREIDCRLVQGAGSGPAPVVGGERVIGRGRRTAQGVVEVSRLRMLDSDTILRTVSLKSWLSVQLLAGIIIIAGAVTLYVQRDQIPPVDVGEILTMLTFILGIALFFRVLRMGLRFRR